MITTNPVKVEQSIEEINRLATAGCELVRLAVPDMAAAKAIKDIKERAMIPLIADIHFDYRLALQAIDSGIDGLRINPGNIGSIDNVIKVVEKAKPKLIPIRIGVKCWFFTTACIRCSWWASYSRWYGGNRIRTYSYFRIFRI